MTHAVGEATSWREISSENKKISCRVKWHSVLLSTIMVGSFALFVDGPGVLGKDMQMSIFIQHAVNDSSKATANIYFLNSMGSDIAWSVS